MQGRRPGRHVGAGRRRTAAWLTALCLPGTALLAGAAWLAASVAGAGSLARPSSSAAWANVANTLTIGPLTAAPVAAPQAPVRDDPNRPVLSPAARRSCPRAATACADLEDHLTWLQSRGRVTYGPVRMEPGAGKDRTPRGTWHVAWKAGAHYISTSFGVPIPYAVFFAPGGIAFHAGSLTSSSHGCIHLTRHDARYYHNHLAVGAEVVVF